MADIPVILFTYVRSDVLGRVLACLRANAIPLLYVFADGAKGEGDAADVARVRAMLRGIDWTELRLVERPANLGLGRNVLAGVGEVAAQHEAFIVCEDDLVCVPGTYAWMCSALRQYADDRRVMSVTGWTHPKVTPAAVGDRPYFDGRAECWLWGTWQRSWQGMETETAAQKMAAARSRGIAPDAYGSDLPQMARAERRRNIWAVRWLYHHLQHNGLCLRPPWSMVEHVGVDPAATNNAGENPWAGEALTRPAPLPLQWPEPAEHPECARLWRAATKARPLSATLRARLSRIFFGR